jgi:Raf kinase inhibitor-like YbhB/YbcL family protein
MRLFSQAFRDNQTISTKYTCDGDNINPPLGIENVPSGTKNLVLIMDDPDSPSSTFLHWTLWNIDPNTVEIPEGASSLEAVQGVNDFGNIGYGGPCPSYGKHRYRFELYALDTTLDLNPSIKRRDLEAAMKGHICGRTGLTGFYKRERPKLDIV